MTKEMIISSNDHETRVAILEDDLVAELFVERERQRGVVGNIYKGRVSKVLPGMQSAFVDIGLERDGFLYVSDVAPTSRLDASDGRRDGRRGGRDAGAEAAATEGRRGAARRCRPRPRAWTRAEGRGAQRHRGAEDRGPAQGRAGRAGPGGQGAARHQGRAPDVARLARRPLPGLHADGRSRRRVAQDRIARRAQPAARHRPRVPRSSRASPAASSSAPRRPAGRKTTSSATSEFFHQMWKEIRQKIDASARPRWCTASRAWSPSCCATC